MRNVLSSLINNLANEAAFKLTLGETPGHPSKGQMHDAAECASCTQEIQDSMCVLYHSLSDIEL
jgi:hypothetical protein